MKILFGLAFLVCAFNCQAASSTMTLTSEVCVGPNNGDRCISQIIKGLHDTNITRIVMPPGRIYVPEHPLAHVLIRGVANKELIGNNTEIILTGDNSPGILIEKSSNIRLNGFSIERLTKPYIQGKISHLDPKEGGVTIEGNDSRSLKVTNAAPVKWATVYRDDGRPIYGSRPVIIVTDLVAESGGGIVVKVAPLELKRRKDLHIGNSLVVVGRRPLAHTIVIDGSDNVHISHVTIHNSSSMAILSKAHCNNIFIENNSIAPRVGELISSNADGIHIISPLGKVVVASNTLVALQDDAIVVANRGYWKVLSESSNSDIADAPYDGAIYSAIMGSNPISRILGPAQVHDGYKFNHQLKLPVFLVPRASSVPSIILQSNTIRQIRGIGFRINAQGVKVINNLIENTTGPAIQTGILLSPIYIPQGPAGHVYIIGNTIRNYIPHNAFTADEGLIDIGHYPNSKDDLVANIGIEDIFISQNKFEGGMGYQRSLIRACGRCNYSSENGQ